MCKERRVVENQPIKERLLAKVKVLMLKCFSHGHKGLHLIPKTHTCSPSAEKAETGSSLGLPGQPT